MGGITKESHSSRLQVRATWARKEFQPTEMLAQGRGIVEQKGIQPALLWSGAEKQTDPFTSISLRAASM